MPAVSIMSSTMMQSAPLTSPTRSVVPTSPGRSRWQGPGSGSGWNSGYGQDSGEGEG